MELDRSPAMVLRDAGIPDRPRPADMGLVVLTADKPPFPRERPRLRPRLLDVGMGRDGGCEPEGKSPGRPALGGEEVDEVGWLLVELMGLTAGAEEEDEEEEELSEFLACAGCWVALL